MTGRLRIDGLKVAARKRIAHRLRRCAALPLRLIIGYGFLVHGLAKSFKGPQAFAAILHAAGVPASHMMAWTTILVEIIGGVAFSWEPLSPS